MNRASLIASLAAAVIAVASCSGNRVYRTEKFTPDSPYQHLFNASVPAACGAAKSALLGQGYLISESSFEAVRAHKEFQPNDETHVDLMFTIDCQERGTQTVVYANAVQERYQLKKTRQSTSLSVPRIGGLSLPFGTSTEELIKTATETVSDHDFYDRFFTLIEKTLAPGKPLAH